MPRSKREYGKQYDSQRQNAKRRGISFEFTYEEWIDWWGNDMVNRGKGAGKLVMARYQDKGPYHSSNVYKSLNTDNVSVANKGRIFSDTHKANLSRAMSKGIISDLVLINRSNTLKTYYQSIKETL